MTWNAFHAMAKATPCAQHQIYASKQAGELPLGRLPHLQRVPEGHAARLRAHDGADPHALRTIPALVADDQGFGRAVLKPGCGGHGLRDAGNSCFGSMWRCRCISDRNTGIRIHPSGHLRRADAARVHPDDGCMYSASGSPSRDTGCRSSCRSRHRFLVRQTIRAFRAPLDAGNNCSPEATVRLNIPPRNSCNTLCS